MKHLATKLAVISLGAFAGVAFAQTVPMVPVTVPMVVAYQKVHVDVGQFTVEPQGQLYAKYIVHSATGTDYTVEGDVTQNQATALGLTLIPYSTDQYAVFAVNGTTTKQAITATQYAAMGAKGGEKQNPTFTTLVPLGSVASAAMATDTQAYNTEESVVSSTFSYTVTGSNTLLLVGGYKRGSGKTVTSVTFNGNSATQVGAQNPDESTYFDKPYSFFILGQSGTHNIVVTSSAADYQSSGAISFTGVNQTGQPDAHTDGSQQLGSDFSLSITTVAAGSWIFLTTVNSNGTCSAGTNSYVANSPAWSLFGLNEYTANPAAAGTYTLHATCFTTVNGTSGNIFSFSPAAGSTIVPSGTGQFIMFN